MADNERHPFGGGIGDYVIETGVGGVATFTSGAVVQFFSARTGGAAYTDITEDQAGTVPLTTVVSQDGTPGSGYALGDFPIIYGPVGVKWMWASADGGPRKIIFATDIAEQIDQLVSAGVITAAGDLLVGTGAGVADRLGVGTNGQVLTVDTAQPGKMRWLTPSGGGGGGVATTSDVLWVAADDAPAQFADAPYLCDGVADEVQINAALANAFGLRVGLSPGTFHLAAPVQILGVDNANAEVSKHLQGSGVYATRLVPTSGILAGIVLGAAVSPHVADLAIEVNGATHGIYSTRSTVPAASDRSFFHGSIKNIAVIGPWDSSHTGWGMTLGSGFRYTVENIEIGGTLNGIRVLNESTALNCGDAVFTRCFVEIYGTNGTAYHVSSPTGNANQIEFHTCHGIAQAGQAGSTGWKFDGAGSTSHVRLFNCNAEQFATTVTIAATAYDIDADFVHVTLKAASTLASVAGYASRVRCGLAYVEAGATVTAINETNGYSAKPNLFDLDIYADTGSTVNATLTTGRVVRGLVDGDTYTASGLLRYKPVGGRTFPFTASGTLAAGVGTLRIYNDTGNDLTFRSARVTINTAYTTGTVLVDINQNGTSILASQSNRPSIAVNTVTSGRATTGIAGAVWTAGSYVTVDIDQVGTAGGPGASGLLVVQLETY